MTRCDKCGNSYSDGFDDVHSCPDPERERLIALVNELKLAVKRLKKRQAARRVQMNPLKETE